MGVLALVGAGPVLIGGTRVVPVFLAAGRQCRSQHQHGEENTFYIKRIIGLPGEIVQVKDGYTYINGKTLTSDIYGREVMDEPGIAEEPIKLGSDEYFVLGDNRNHSQDSRDPYVGVLKRSDLLGRAFIRIYPLNKFGVIKHE